MSIYGSVLKCSLYTPVRLKNVYLIFRLCCYHHTAIWCDYITWISSTLWKWNRLYLEYSTFNWTIDTIPFSKLWNIYLVRFNSFHCKVSKNLLNMHFQWWQIICIWWWFKYISHAGKLLSWFFATQPNLFKQPPLYLF